MPLRTPQEIENEMYRANKYVNAGSSQFSGMSYEEGIEAALRWALGEEDTKPIETDYEEED